MEQPINIYSRSVAEVGHSPEQPYCKPESGLLEDHIKDRPGSGPDQLHGRTTPDTEDQAPTDGFFSPIYPSQGRYIKGVRYFDYAGQMGIPQPSDRGALPQQELLRHDNMTTTDIYLRAIRGIRPETMELMKDPLGMHTSGRSYTNRIPRPKRKGAR